MPTLHPKISCITPTANRRSFIPKAIEYFLRQDYPNKELLILDDGGDPIGDLVPEKENIRYIHLDKKLTIGAKRNMACEMAKGEIIAHWDDDDWHAPHRLSYQVRALLQEGKNVCGINNLLFYAPKQNRAWRYVYPSVKRFWLSGSSLCYRHSFWEKHPFPNISIGEDARFIWSSSSENMMVLPNSDFHVGIVHANNVSPKRTSGSYWQEYYVEDICYLLGDDWSFYCNNQHFNQSSNVVVQINPQFSKRSISMVTVAREEDLALPEFVAFNQGKNLPRMRCWELPFALFKAQLNNTMAVLDCTINPAGFQKFLTELYPDVLYRHWNPIQDGQFILPFGIPDNSFDRVICINTLEHLLKSQREKLLASLSCKLKTGGRLILTSDYYFDSFWERSELLSMGVMHSDRQEVFNGWNKVNIKEWLEICQHNNLQPIGEMTQEDPCESGRGLYLNKEPYPHACIGGVFSKEVIVPAVSKKIVLALLTWNTKDISIDSVNAYLREAYMLKRLGHQPFICVCDNGSTDGTAEALKVLEKEVDIPHNFIFNKENLGNSIARNQIIDVMLQWKADYLLFIDGDIEVGCALLQFCYVTLHGK